MNKEVTKYIENAPEVQREIMLTLRSLIWEAVPNATEAFKWNRPVYVDHKDFAYILANKNHVNLGFNDFEKIRNPNKQLEGTGKTMRHVKIKSLNDIDKTLFKSWLMDITQSAT